MMFDRSRLRLRLLALMAGSLLVLAACGDDSGSSSDSGNGEESTESAEGAQGSDGCTSDICMEGIAYTETEIVVSTGDTVTWTNLDGVPHTVTAGTPDAPAGEVFDSGSIGEDDSFDLPFAAAGEFAFYCTIHPQMQGTVIVE